MTRANNDGVSTVMGPPGVETGGGAVQRPILAPPPAFSTKERRLAGGALGAGDGLGRDGDAVLSRPLGLVEGRVRGGEQRRSRLRLGMGGDAEARGHRDGLTVDRKDDPPGEGSPDAVRDMRGALEISPG